jgi:hypothetical protein
VRRFGADRVGDCGSSAMLLDGLRTSEDSEAGSGSVATLVLLDGSLVLVEDSEVAALRRGEILAAGILASSSSF